MITWITEWSSSTMLSKVEFLYIFITKPGGAGVSNGFGEKFTSVNEEPY